MSGLSRRELLRAGAGAAAGLAGTAMPAAGGTQAARAAPATDTRNPKKERWVLALNTSSIRPASVEDKIKATAQAGYDEIELWDNDLEGWEKSGKSLQDLSKQIKDCGLAVANVIGFSTTMPPTDEEMPKALEALRQRVRRAAAIGARHIAAVPTPDRPDIDVRWAAKRYADLVAVGSEAGVGVALEFLGLAKGIHTLGQAAAIVVESGRPEGSIVADTFHVHNGGSAWSGVRFLSGSIYAVWHVNDVPAEPAPGKMKDSDRLYPGDGVLPLKQMLRDLWANGFRGPLSLEIFNREEYKKPPAEVAKRGIEKIRAVIAASGTGA